MQSEEDNKALVRRFYNEFYGRKNAGAMDDAYSPGYVHHIPDVLGNSMDFNDYKKRQTQFLEAFEDFRDRTPDSRSRQVVTSVLVRDTGRRFAHPPGAGRSKCSPSSSTG
jgi:hypothetical protein